MPRALISVSDKRGIIPFAQGLIDLGWEISAECRPMLGKMDERLVINVVSGVG